MSRIEEAQMKLRDELARTLPEGMKHKCRELLDYIDELITAKVEDAISQHCSTYDHDLRQDY